MPYREEKCKVHGRYINMSHVPGCPMCYYRTPEQIAELLRQKEERIEMDKVGFVMCALKEDYQEVEAGTVMRSYRMLDGKKKFVTESGRELLFLDEDRYILWLQH